MEFWSDFGIAVHPFEQIFSLNLVSITVQNTHTCTQQTVE